jgi:hypothetical protein
VLQAIRHLRDIELQFDAMGWRQFKLVCAIFALAMLAKAVSAAEIKLLPEKIQGYSPIVIKGEIFLGDDERFENIALQIDKAIVFLESPGGSALAAIKIGKAVRLRQFTTAVPENSDCASACGIIWLGGTDRLVFPGGRVGFHVAFLDSDGKVSESGQANAVVGAYFNQLGLTQSAIEYLTQSPPDSITWLGERESLLLGITAYFVPARANSETQVPPAEPKTTAPAANSNTDANQFVRLEKQDIYGFDLPGNAPDVASATECEQLCAKNAQCMAYSFNARKMKCYLKSGGDRIVWNREVTTGYVKALESNLRKTKLVFFSSTDLKGEEFYFVLDSTVESCITLCEDRAQCTGFTFARKQQGRCSLRSGKLKKTPGKNITTGVKTSE